MSQARNELFLIQVNLGKCKSAVTVSLSHRQLDRSLHLCWLQWPMPKLDPEPRSGPTVPLQRLLVSQAHHGPVRAHSCLKELSPPSISTAAGRDPRCPRSFSSGSQRAAALPNPAGVCAAPGPRHGARSLRWAAPRRGPRVGREQAPGTVWKPRIQGVGVEAELGPGQSLASAEGPRWGPPLSPPLTH